MTDCVIALGPLANLENVEDGVEEGEELLADGGFADEDGKEPQRDVQVLLEGSIFYFGSIFGINYLINIQHTCIKHCWGRAKMSKLIPHYHYLYAVEAERLGLRDLVEDVLHEVANDSQRVLYHGHRLRLRINRFDSSKTPTRQFG